MINCWMHKLAKSSQLQIFNDIYEQLNHKWDKDEIHKHPEHKINDMNNEIFVVQLPEETRLKQVQD